MSVNVGQWRSMAISKSALHSVPLDLVGSQNVKRVQLLHLMRANSDRLGAASFKGATGPTGGDGHPRTVEPQTVPGVGDGDPWHPCHFGHSVRRKISTFLSLLYLLATCSL
jgi:hypothetical protein